MPFTTVSKLGKIIRLTARQESHILSEHTEMESQQDKIKETIENPDYIFYSPKDKNFHYVKKYKSTPVSEKSALAIVKHLDGEGFIITCFFISAVRKLNKESVYEREDVNKL